MVCLYTKAPKQSTLFYSDGVFVHESAYAINTVLFRWCVYTRMHLRNLHCFIPMVCLYTKAPKQSTLFYSDGVFVKKST